MPTEKTNPAEDQRLAPTMAPQRVMRIIEALSESREGLTLTQLCARTSLPKTSLFSLLRSLAEGSYVISEGKSHRLGPETYRIAAVIYKTDRFPGNVRPMLEELQKACGETVMLGVPTEDWMSLIYADVIESTSWLRFSANVGAHRPLYSTSVGKVILAYTDEKLRQRYLKNTDLVPKTAYTKVTRQALIRELDDIRANGYVISRGSVEGATGMAAPVFNAEGQLVAAVATAGPSERFERQRAHLLASVRDCAAKMSSKLGYNGT
ncbi:MAG: IclR family transcriptional regulator [Comamonadaceae bacterium]|nr:MAG: IclR family transcriptional regulator [Comamonadaceae bacterium]